MLGKYLCTHQLTTDQTNERTNECTKYQHQVYLVHLVVVLGLTEAPGRELGEAVLHVAAVRLERRGVR